MHSAPSSTIEQVEALAASGRTTEAATLLQREAGRGNADACFTLAAWSLEGRRLGRDLAAARTWFGRAAEGGRSDAAAIHTAFLANGTGGDRDWPGALASLRRRSEQKDVLASNQLALIEAMDLDEQGEPTGRPRSELLSTSPRVSVARNFVTEAECAYLAEMASRYFAPSVVVDPSSGQLIRNPIRTSDVAAFPLALEDPAIHAINRRIAALTGTRAAQGEPLQVLRYEVRQEYKPHYDALPPGGNQRILTVLVWLNDGYEGGETTFLANGLTVRGGVGDALVFANATADGRPDQASRHAGLPVTCGSKLLASRWIRQEPLDLTGPSA